MQSKESAENQMNFSGIVLGFSTATLSYLGLIKTKDQNSSELNLTLAEQNIEILAILEEKTRGNLNPDEDKMLKAVLTDLRVRFVEAAKSSRHSK